MMPASMVPASTEGIMHCDRLFHRHLVTCRDTDSARRAAELMRDHDVGFLPVCDEWGTAIGVVTDRDLVLRVDAAGRSPNEVLLDQIMSSPVITCDGDAAPEQLEALMSTHRTRRILVVRDGRPIGVVSLADLAPHVRYEDIGRTYRKVVAID
jgi:CBS domain-containing protein